jgi:uncharacterized membrane-anchored protein
MTDEQRAQRIEAYLDNVLSELERLDFEREMTRNKDLQKQVLLQETIRLAFKKTADMSLNKQMDELFEQNRYRFEQKLDTGNLDADFLEELGFESTQNTEQQKATITPLTLSSSSRQGVTVLKPVYKKRWFFLAIAASLTLIMGIGWWWFASKPVVTEGVEMATPKDKNTANPDKKDNEAVKNTPLVTENPQPKVDKKGNTMPNVSKEKQTIPSNQTQIANINQQASDFIQKITSLTTVEKNMASTVMGGATKQDAYEIAVQNYVKNGNTKGFEDYLKTDGTANNYKNIKRLIHACFRLKNYDKAIAYCLIGQKLADVEADEKKEFDLLLLESYYGNYPKYKSTIQNIFETGSIEEKKLVKMMEDNGFKD